MKTSAAKGLAHILKTEGVEWVSTFPICSANNALAEEGLRLIMMRDDRYAVALADAFSRVTGGKKIGVCTVMGGANPAGLQIAFGALAQAYEDSSPVLCITDGLAAGDTALANFDMSSGLNSVTKWTGHIDQAHRVPEFMRRAFSLLRNGRPGPVLLTLPKNCGDYDEDQHPYTPVKRWKSAPCEPDVKAAVQALLRAKRPLIYVGQGVFYADATDELLQFAEMTRMPVLTTLNAKSAFPENHALSIGVRGEPAVHSLEKCDLILAVGCSLANGRFRHAVPQAKDKIIIQCNVSERDINRHYHANFALLGDAGLTLQALKQEYAAQKDGQSELDPGLAEKVKVLKEQMDLRYRTLMESSEKPINSYRVYGDLMKAIDLENSFVTPDSGNTRDQTSTVFESLIPHGFLGWGNVTTLGYGLAAAMAAKLAYPERQCVNITGDAGVNYMLGNFEPLMRYGVGVTTIHLNNDGFSGYGPGFWGEGHDPYTWEVTDHTIVNMAQAVRALGYHSERVEEPADIIPALERAFDENRRNKPAYLEFICSRHPVFGAWIR